MSTNIQDIAENLKISKSTVSRALRNHPDISQATKDKVTQMAENLRYEPNLVAQALTTKKTFTIGVVIPHIGHSFFSEALQGMGEVLHEAGYHFLIAASNEDTEREHLNIKNLLAKRVDGLIISIASNTIDKDRFQNLIDKNIPFVFFDRKISGLPVSSVSIPYEKIYKEKINYMLKDGIKRIAYIDSNIESFYSNQKLGAFQQAISAHADHFEHIDFIQTTPDVEGGLKAFEELLHKGLPQLVDASASMQAMGVLKAAQQHNINVPGDLEIFGNYITPVTELLNPRISGAHFSIEEMGKKAAQLLLDHLNQKDKQPDELHVEALLCLRETTKIKKV
jgi:LacI family transcriptional regulator